MIDPSNPIGHSGSETDQKPSTRTNNWQRDWQIISCALAVVLLLLAAEETWDYSYYGDGFYTLEEPFYIFLHIYVTGLALVLGFIFWKQERAIWLVAAVVTAILFNPAMRIDINNWVTYGIAAGGFAFVAMRSPSVEIAKFKRKEAALGIASGSAADELTSTTPAADPQSSHEVGFNTVDSGAFDGKRMRTTLYWGVILATGAEFVFRSAFSEGEDRGTNVLVFVLLGIAAWLIGRQTRSETAAAWIFGFISLGFLGLSLSRHF